MRRIAGSVAFRGGGFAPRNLPLAGVATLLGLVALWQLGDWLGLIPTLFLPSPAAIAVALYRLTVSGELWKHLSASLARLAIGWIVGTVFGIALGLAVGTVVAAALAGHGGGLGAVPDPEDRAGAAVHHLVRHRRRLEDRHAGVRRVLPHRDRHRRRRGQRAALADPHGAEFRPVACRDRAQGGAAGRAAGDPQRLPRHRRRSPSCCWSPPR